MFGYFFAFVLKHWLNIQTRDRLKSWTVFQIIYFLFFFFSLLKAEFSSCGIKKESSLVFLRYNFWSLSWIINSFPQPVFITVCTLLHWPCEEMHPIFYLMLVMFPLLDKHKLQKSRRYCFLLEMLMPIEFCLCFVMFWCLKCLA